MKFLSSTLLATFSSLSFTIACQPKSGDSNINAKIFTGEVLGVEAGRASIEELEEFATGGKLGIAEKFMNATEREMTRTAISRKHFVNPKRMPEAIESPKGKEMLSLVCKFVNDSQCSGKVPNALLEATKDGHFTIVELIKLYPGDKFRMNMIAFQKTQGDLENSMTRFKNAYGPGR
jgi:hypothetical protein